MPAMTAQEILARLYANARATDARLARLETSHAQLAASNEALQRDLAQARADLTRALNAPPTYTPRRSSGPDYHQSSAPPVRIPSTQPTRYAPGQVPAASQAVLEAEPIPLESTDDDAF